MIMQAGLSLLLTAIGRPRRIILGGRCPVVWFRRQCTWEGLYEAADVDRIEQRRGGVNRHLRRHEGVHWLVCACEACVPERVGSAGCSIRLSCRDQHQFDSWFSEESQAHRYSLMLGPGMSARERPVPESEDEMDQAQREMNLLESWGRPQPTQPMDTSANLRKREDAEGEANDRASSKYRKSQGKGKSGQPQPLRSRRQVTTQEGASQQDCQELCKMMSRLLLRHEDQMSIDRTQHGFIMFFKKTEISIIPTFQERAEAWRQIKLTKPQDLTMSLHVALSMTMFKEILTRLNNTTPGASTDAMIKLNYLTKDLKLPYLEYKAESKAMVIKEDLEPVTLEDMKKRVGRLQELCALENFVLRFHSTRPMPDGRAETIPFLLQIGHRTQAAMEVWATLQQLCHNSAWHLVGGSLRQERQGRSPLAEAVNKLANKMPAT